MAGSIIELSDLTKKYGSVTAVDQLNLSIRKGEIFGLLGPNGAGKSTTILMMLGLTEPTSGSVRVCDIDPARNPIEVKRKVGYLPENVGFYNNLNGVENLLFTAQMNSIPRKEALQKAEELLVRVGLSDAGSKKTGKYSRGMLQRLGLADVLIKNPEVIILDEPTLGIDPTGVREFLELIVKLSRDEGLTVLFSSHDLHQVQQVCDRVGLFVHGKLLAEGDIQTLSKELFSRSPYIIEAGITQTHPDGSELSGKHPTPEEFMRIIFFIILSILYVAFWLNLSILFSVLFRQPATSALSGISVWLFFLVFYGIIINLITKGIAPPQFAPENVIINFEELKITLMRFMPNQLFSDATTTLLMPSVRSLGPLTMEQVIGTVPDPLPLGQSVLLVWPQVTGLIAATILCFALSYFSFMRREIRSR